MKQTDKSKYPIILVHGLNLKDVLFFKSFGRIEKILKKEGFAVYSAKIDGFGAIETNAEQLKDYVNKILQRHNTDKVNLIAHSKGGLDSKYM
ncbi:MAG: triacylglycerol lipase, partial [Clostridia bacterium]|nr:triacylglycerol lipase [Clostridia bacterium]